jgi:hypothetical protein
LTEKWPAQTPQNDLCRRISTKPGAAGRERKARTQLALEFLEGERGDVFAKDFPLEGYSLKSAPFLACHDEP